MKKLIKLLIINIIIANIALVAFDIKAFTNIQHYQFAFSFSISVSLSCWSSFWVTRVTLDRIMPFEQYYIYRYLADTFIMLLLAIISILAVTYFFSLFFVNIQMTSEHNIEKILYTILSFFVTFPIVNSIIFMNKWKKSVKEAELLRQRQFELEYDSLKNQMNPHFLFNSLNSLTALIETDQKKSVDFVQTLSQIYRYILDNKTENTVTLNKEIIFAESYLSLQKIRFGDSLHYINNIKTDQHTLVIPLSIQILFENALKHNIISKKQNLTIEVYSEEGFIIVKNNLQLKKQVTKGKGIGLNNIKELYKQSFDKTVEVIKTSDFFIVKIPLITIK